LICDLLNHPIEVKIGDLEKIILLVMASAFGQCSWLGGILIILIFSALEPE